MVYIYCEGFTEEIFVRRLLTPFLQSRNVFVQTILAARGMEGRRGGVASYEQIKRELIRVCREHPNEMVTALVDYSPVRTLDLVYDDSGSEEDVVRSKERAIEDDISLRNLVMNFELHEFEAYLYCNPDAFRVYGRKVPSLVRGVVESSGGPESINTDPNNLPSRRLDAIIPRYTLSKTVHTKMILENLTLDQVRSACPHFNRWLDRVCKEAV